MISKLFEYFDNCTTQRYTDNQHKLLLTRYALEDLTKHKRGKELDKCISDLITFADGLKEVKAAKEPVILGLNHQVTFNNDNTYTIQSTNLY